MGGNTGDSEVGSCADGGKRAAVRMKKEIGVLQAVSIIFGVIVGSGIFVSPVGVLRYSNSVGLSLIMWIVPGLFSMLGALVYAELGVRIPKSGGEYAYILEAFGGLPAFIVMWITFVVIGGVSCAANSIVFAEYMLQPVYPDCAIPGPVVSMIALCGLSKLAVIFSFGKVVALLLIISFGVYYLATGHVESFHNTFEGSNVSPGYLALSFYQGFWAFSGWNYLNFLVEEMKNPGRNLPLAIGIALSLVTGLYMLTNIAYLAVLSPYEMLATGSGSSAIAVVFAERAMPWISMLMPVFVGASVFGSINGEAMSMSRLTYTGAREGHMPSILAMIHHCNFTPIPAILILLAGFAFSFIAALAVTALLYMRYKEPNLRTSFQLPIFFPILFLICDLFILVLTIYQQPRESLSNVILMLVAVPIYWLGVSWENKPKSFQNVIYKGTVFLQKVFACVPVEDESQLN
ncbi:cationic amino acid transporter [Echinococcus multilocularis]|uniref:Cationic amino acid transporter n=1 Tax=Echinococcus multilocularis TaxID=6211 RepID=A0A068YGP3_ECHMU|nr:cationic amino acid transporter [Echinococcus multilocularis]